MASDAPTIAETIRRHPGRAARLHRGHLPRRPPDLDRAATPAPRQEGVLFQAPLHREHAALSDRPRFADLDLSCGPDTVRRAHRSSSAISSRCSTIRRTPTRRRRSNRRRGMARASSSRPVPVRARPSPSCFRCWPSWPPRRRTARVVRTLPRSGARPLPDERTGQRPTRPSTAALGRPARHGAVQRLGRPPARFARYTSRTLYPGVRTAKKDQQRLGSIEDFYSAPDRSGCDTTRTPGTTQAKALIGKLRQRGKWPAKPDLKAWYGPSGARWQDAKTAIHTGRHAAG